MNDSCFSNESAIELRQLLKSLNIEPQDFIDWFLEEKFKFLIDLIKDDKNIEQIDKLITDNPELIKDQKGNRLICSVVLNENKNVLEYLLKFNWHEQDLKASIQIAEDRLSTFSRADTGIHQNGPHASDLRDICTLLKSALTKVQKPNLNIGENIMNFGKIIPGNSRTNLWQLVRMNNENLASQLLDIRDDDQEQNSLFTYSNIYSKDNSIRVLCEKLESNRSLATQTDKYGNTFILTLAAVGNLEALKKIRNSKGVYFDWKHLNNIGLDLASLSIIFNQKKIFYWLKSQGLIGKIKLSSTALFPYLESYKELELNCFHMAICLGNKDIADLFLQQKQDDYSSTIPKFGNPFHLAVLADQTQMIPYLINYFGERTSDKLNEPGWHNLSVYSLAAYFNRPETLEWLITRYSVSNDKGVKQDQLKLALTIAIKRGNLQAVEKLIDFLEYEVLQSIRINVPENDFPLTLEQSAQYYYAQNRENIDRQQIDFLIQKNFQKGAHEQFHATNFEDKQIYQLAFAGGGAKGLALVGAFQGLEAIDEGKYLAGLDRVVGTSAGAILAALVAVGMTGNQVEAELAKIDLAQLTQDNGIISRIDEPGVINFLKNAIECCNRMGQTAIGLFRAPCSAGIFEGKNLMAWLSNVIAQHLLEIAEFEGGKVAEKIKRIPGILTVSANDLSNAPDAVPDAAYLKMTLGDLAELVHLNPKRFRHLHVIATQLNENASPVKSVKINSESKNGTWLPVLLIDAVRASMSIPLYFIPYTLRQRASDETIVNFQAEKRYIDGGVFKNYPVERFDKLRFFRGDNAVDSKKPRWNPNILGLNLVYPAHQDDVIVSRLKKLLSKILTKIKQNVYDNTLIELISELGTAYYDAERIIADFQQGRYNRTINISNCDIKTTQFQLTSTEQLKLWNAGVAAVQNAFKLQEPPIPFREERAISLLP